MLRVLILCTHNSARSQMAEGLVRHAAQHLGLALDVQSAGTEATQVKPPAVQVMAELGIDLSGHHSKTLWDLPDPWTFDHVVTVCDSAAENCPNYPAQTTMHHYPFTDPSGGSLDRWRAVRDQMRAHFDTFVRALHARQPLPPSSEQTPPVAVA